MEKEFGRIKKNETTEIVVRIDEYKGKMGLTIREFVTSEGYTGYTKAGTRITGNSFIEFRDLINQIDYNDLINEEPEKKTKKPKKKKEVVDKTKNVVEEKKEDVVEDSTEETVENTEVSEEKVK
ncbi:hypothetical protein GOV12_05030 [Candidatus Pacearchaeota archaeon]|nr:hypothetical protein [Candidatus Pacearchaeota archaeon]